MGEPGAFSSVARAPNQASAGGAQISGHASEFSKDFPANEVWMEIFVIIIYQGFSHILVRSKKDQFNFVQAGLGDEDKSNL